MLIFLALVPVFIAAYIWMQQQRRGLAARFGNPALVQESGGGAGSVRAGAKSAGGPRLLRRHIPPALFLVALIILIIALARPQTVVSLPRLEGTIILAFDVSGSMAADDLEPTRIEAAKAAARRFVESQPSTVRVGVVSFSDGGFATQPPTNDQAAILAAINRLTLQRGTSLARGIEAALNVIEADSNEELTLATGLTETLVATPTPVPKGTYKPAVIVLLTDGENNQTPDPLEAAQVAADRGVRVHSIGIGSAEGATLHIEGFSVRSRLDEATLRQISELTGGTYYGAENEEELRTIYDELNPELVLKPQETEVTALFAGAGILVLMIGGLLSLLWLGRVP
jgi:Ca-activated chloride channel family protein